VPFCRSCEEAVERDEWCPECGACAGCCECDDALFDADELGLDPETDDERGY